jgi:hypothetical protein
MWTLLNPILAWAAAAALIPLVLHLMQRRRAVRVRFSTLRFLREAQKRSSRRVRMENLLLWLLRTAVILALAAAFALPVLRLRGLGRLGGASQRDVAIVLDVSYSMGYESAQRRVWDEARAAAIGVVDSLRRGDRVCIVLADGDVRPLIEQPTSDLGLALSLLKAQEPGTSPCALRPAVAAAVRALRGAGRREREVHIITDGQALPWAGFAGGESPALSGPRPAADSNAPAAAAAAEAAPPLPRDLSLFVTLAGAPSPRNAFPRELEVEPSLLLAGAPARVLARFGCSGPPEDLAVTVSVDGEEITRRSLALRGDAPNEVELVIPALAAGARRLEVSVPADGLALDDRFHAVLRVYERLRVLCVGTAEDAFYLMKALHPGGRAGGGLDADRVEPAAFAGENLRAYACVFLCNALPMSGQGILALEEHVRRGGTLVVFPGYRAGLADYASWNCLPARPTGVAEIPPDHRVATLRLVARRDPVLTGLRLPPGTVPTVSLQRVLTWGEEQPDSATLLAAGADTPFLRTRTFGLGRVLCFGVAADRQWSTFPLSALFLPITHQIVHFGAGAGRRPLHFWTSRRVALTDTLPDLPAEAQVTGPDGAPVALRRSREEARMLLDAENLMAPGIYLVRRTAGDAPEPAFAINVRRSESDLTPVEPAALSAMTGVRTLYLAQDREGLLRRIEEHRRGRPLVEPLLWAALALAVVEVTLANRLSRKSGSLLDRLLRNASGRVITRTVS